MIIFSDNERAPYCTVCESRVEPKWRKDFDEIGCDETVVIRGPFPMQTALLLANDNFISVVTSEEIDRSIVDSWQRILQ